MTLITATVDGESFRTGFLDASRILSTPVMIDDVELVADEILRRAITSPIPSDVRDLARSADSIKRKDHVTFGFNTRYAAFQDAPGRSLPYTIVPRLKKVLYVPITRKGRTLHRRGNNPLDEGLEKGVDYFLTQKVVIPIKPYGSAIGPNHYFSETLKRNVDFVFDTLTDFADDRFLKRFPVSQKRLRRRARRKKT